MGEESQGKTAVICEDEGTTMIYIRQVLKLAGVRVLSAVNTGVEAVAQVLEHRPDLIFMDIHMPLMSGTEALRLIRAADPDYRPVIIMVTAFDDEEHRKKAAEAGAGGYVVKPFTGRLLLQELERVCATHFSVAPERQSSGRRAQPPGI